jgi:DNA (cytosine-5)-methyltransferase 1
MLKNKKLTYVTLFSSGGVGCFGLKMEGFQCVATNEIVAKRMHVLNVGLKTDYFEHLQTNDFRSVIDGIEVNYK